MMGENKRVYACLYVVEVVVVAVVVVIMIKTLFQEASYVTTVHIPESPQLENNDKISK